MQGLTCQGTAGNKQKIMKLTKNIPQNVIEQIVTGIMENFPEASSGCELACVGWRYAALNFRFKDSEGKSFLIGKEELLKAFPLIFTNKWPKGCTQPPHAEDYETWLDWLCQCDATDFDAFAHLACLGEVIYG